VVFYIIGPRTPIPAEKHAFDWLFLPYPEPGIHGHDAEPALPAEIPFWAAQNA
jgi:hypothetical protein